MLTDRYHRKPPPLKMVHFPETSRSNASFLQLAGMPMRKPDEHLPAIKGSHALFMEHTGTYDLRKLYDEWRASLAVGYKVPRLCRLDQGKLPVLQEHVKRRVSQHSASSPPTFRTRNESLHHKSLRVNIRNDTDKTGAGSRYECMAKIGQGSYGNVYKCRDRETGRIVAIKKFIESEDNPSIKKIAFREIKILKVSATLGQLKERQSKGPGILGLHGRRKTEATDAVAVAYYPVARLLSALSLDCRCAVFVNCLRDRKLYQQLHHPNIVTLIEVFRRKQKLHLVFEYCSRTLLEEIQFNKSGGADVKKNPTRYAIDRIPEMDARRIISQVLQALRVVHRNRFIHRDIKPENILLTSRRVVKLCDFGFARPVNKTVAEIDQYTDYVATRWYRAPELLMPMPAYGPSVDVWATGCVFAECISRQALLPGTTDIDQLYLIRKMFGDTSNLPSIHVQLTSGSDVTFDGTTDSPLRRVPLHKKLPFISKEGCEMLGLMMQINPLKRASANELLQKPYFGIFTGASGSSGVNKPTPKIFRPKVDQSHPPIINHDHHAPVSKPATIRKVASHESLTNSESPQLSMVTLPSVPENLNVENVYHETISLTSEVADTQHDETLVENSRATIKDVTAKATGDPLKPLTNKKHKEHPSPLRRTRSRPNFLPHIDNKTPLGTQ